VGEDSFRALRIWVHGESCPKWWQSNSRPESYPYTASNYFKVRVSVAHRRCKRGGEPSPRGAGAGLKARPDV
jgi:hypothetical protein